jgi:glyoxylase-like metal-dependent hydrolase (beta-lactamase superfamily II)
MYGDSYRFTIGAFECLAIHDFQSSYPAATFFTNVPAETLNPVLQEHGLGQQLPSPYPCLFVDTGSAKVLVDTGMGSGVHPERGPYAGKLFEVLDDQGIAPEEVDTVILTHGHVDHIGGCTDESGRPAFAHADYVMWRDEWEFWTGAPDLSSLTMPDALKRGLIDGAQEQLPPLESQLRLIDEEGPILPGIEAVEAKGHTPGHFAVSISSSREQLLYISDTVLHPLHLEYPNWHTTVYDIDLAQAAASKRRVFDRAADEHALVMAFHFDPFPSLGHVSKHGDGWLWQPMITK